MEQLKIFCDHLPRKARSCDVFDIDNKVRSIESALTKKYIQPNDFNARTWLVYDIDRATCPDEIREDKFAPEPTVFVSNPDNRHAHLLYLLDTPIHNNQSSSQKALRFAAAVDCGLANKLDADMSYVGLLTKNPMHKRWEVLETVPQSYELYELAEYVDTNLLNTAIKKLPEYGLGRNSMLFDKVSKWAYKAIRQGWPAFDQWVNAVLSRTEMLNAQFNNPMGYSEYKQIAKSIAKWTHRNMTESGFSQWQANNGKRSGIARSKLTQDKRLEAIEMRTRGVTQQSIAEYFNVNRRTVIRWLKTD
jgi:DNA-binding transcriptional regulator YiaG